MAIISLPELIILEILSYITDQPTLANVALTCKTLRDAVSSRRYHTFPVSGNAVANWSMRELHEKFAHIKALSARNARFIRHLIIDPVTDLLCPDMVASLRNCVQLHSLT